MNIQEKVKLATLSMQRYSWEQGTVAQAFLELGDKETVVALAKDAVNRQISDGRVAVMGDTNGVTDPCANGEALLYAYEVTGDEVFRIASDKLLKWALIDAPRNTAGTVYHVMNGAEFWVDSFYMLPPFLARAKKYSDALNQINGYWEALFCKESGLLSHQWNDAEKVFLRKAFWGVGNGWAMAGMARVISLLPDELSSERNLLIQRVKTLINSSLPFMRMDGLFHDVIDDTSTFIETNFSQMIAYTIYRGIAQGWLDTSYRKFADRMRTAANSKIDDYGLVQGVCGAPRFDQAGVAPEGQAFNLLMEAAYKSYSK